jgi:hypothetical protein
VPAHVAIGIRRAGPASPAGVEEPSGARRGDRIPPFSPCKLSSKFQLFNPHLQARARPYHRGVEQDV